MEKIKAEQWIDEHEQEIIEFLQQIIRIPSVTGDEAEIQEYIHQVLEKMGMEVDMFVPSVEELKKHPAYVSGPDTYENRPNVVGVLKGEGGGRSLLLNGHVDVIPEGPEDAWKHGCWSGDIEDGKLYGRGASDMKSGVAAMTMAVKAIRESGMKLKGDLIAEYVMDEELTGNGTLACVVKGYQADAGICCETSSMCVQPGSIGRIWYTIKVKGKAAGIQRRYEGINAIELGYMVNHAVAEFERVRMGTVSHPLYPNIISAIPCMIGMFESGSYNSSFPDSCILKGSLATVPGEDSKQVKEDFVSFVTKKCAENPWMRKNPPEVIFEGYFAEASSIPTDSPIVTALCKEYETVMKHTPVISGREGAADIRFMNQYGNTPTVIFGPGRTEQMHANNEWVEVKDYLQSVRILARTIVEWCGEA